MLSERALVVVFLRGGADTLNLLIPSGDDAYLRHRPTLGLTREKDGALPLDEFYSVHPQLAALLPAWHEGRLGFVQAVGVEDASGSHFELQDRLEAGEGLGQSLGGGWAGRALRTAGAGPMSGVAVGERIQKALRGAPSITAFARLAELALPSAGREHGAAQALAALYGADASTLGQRAGDLLTTVERLAGLAAAPHRPPLDYPEGAFGRALADLATVLRAGLGVRIACVDLANWDTHFVQAATFAGLAHQLGAGLAAFDADLGEARAAVTVLVVTEFGRRLYENGSGGTDHGRGFTALVLGAGVRGGVHGAWPGFEDDGFPGPGGLARRCDVRALLAEAVGALGLDETAVFPGFSGRPTGVFGG